MKLFQMQLHRGRTDTRVILAHFPSQKEALEHVNGKFAGCEIRNLVEITQPAHFVIADAE